MDITKDSFEGNITHEWLITNGLGGYASSSICGCNTRKYHGLLVAAIGNNAERMLCLSKLNETLIIKSEEYSLSTNECNNFIEKGYLYQKTFRKDFLPTFEYEVKDVPRLGTWIRCYFEDDDHQTIFYDFEDWQTTDDLIERLNRVDRRVAMNRSLLS